MSLATIISQSIDEDLQSYTDEEAKKTATLEKEYEAKVEDLQQLYNETIEAQVNEKVHLQTYTVKRGYTFQNTEDISRIINDAYMGILKEMLETGFFKDMLKRFFANYPSDTPVTVSGKYADELVSAVTAMDISAQKIDGDGLGTITYATAQQEAELTLEDALEKAKLQTIDRVMKLLRKHD